MKDLFKDAYFGKPYKTKDERKALFLTIRTNNSSPVEDALIELLIDNYPKSPKITICNSLGQCINSYHANENIVSEWKEEIEISEEELDKLADEESLWLADVPLQERRFKEGFKAGCHKIMEYLANKSK